MLLDTNQPCILLLQDRMIYIGQGYWHTPVFLDGQPVIGSAVFQTHDGRHGLILNLGHSVVSNISTLQFHHIIISITCLPSRMTHIFWYIYILGCLSGL